MNSYQSRDGHTVTIEANSDGSFTVTNEIGNVQTYGADVATNIYKDWALEGVDLSASGVPPEIA